MIALEDEGKISERIFEPRATQKIIFSILSDFLDTDTVSALEGIVVGLGPGSFTGVKIGVMAAKTLAWALEIPIFGVGSLDLIAAGTPVAEDMNTKLIVAVRSMRGEVYIKTFRINDGIWKADGGIDILSLNAQSVSGYFPSGPVIISGESAPELSEFLEGKLDFILADERKRFPSGEALFRLADSKSDSSKKIDAISLVPDYILLSQPERREGKRIV